MTYCFAFWAGEKNVHVNVCQSQPPSTSQVLWTVALDSKLQGLCWAPCAEPRLWSFDGRHAKLWEARWGWWIGRWDALNCERKDGNVIFPIDILINDDQLANFVLGEDHFKYLSNCNGMLRFLSIPYVREIATRMEGKKHRWDSRRRNHPAVRPDVRCEAVCSGTNAINIYHKLSINHPKNDHLRHFLEFKHIVSRSSIPVYPWNLKLVNDWNGLYRFTTHHVDLHGGYLLVRWYGTRHRLAEFIWPEGEQINLAWRLETSRDLFIYGKRYIMHHVRARMMESSTSGWECFSPDAFEGLATCIKRTCPRFSRWSQMWSVAPRKVSVVLPSGND